MTTTGELYVQAMAATQRFVDAVRPDQWHNPTPCSEWDVKTVANHIIGENLWAGELFAGKTIADVGNRLDGDLAGSDPAAAYQRSIGLAEAAVETPGAMKATVHLSFGDFSGADYASQLFMDLLVHGWDIAKGSGQDARLDPNLVEACLPIAEKLTREWRSAGVFGDELQVPADGTPQTKLLALFGRKD
ncbi:MAG: TIGR03086 family protein [Chloroflexota bacterium]|nr:TIGR03086 family protein [Chloroflexota bacterium]